MESRTPSRFGGPGLPAVAACALAEKMRLLNKNAVASRQDADRWIREFALIMRISRLYTTAARLLKNLKEGVPCVPLIHRLSEYCFDAA